MDPDRNGDDRAVCQPCCRLRRGLRRQQPRDTEPHHRWVGHRQPGAVQLRGRRDVPQHAHRRGTRHGGGGERHPARELQLLGRWLRERDTDPDRAGLRPGHADRERASGRGDRREPGEQHPDHRPQRLHRIGHRYPRCWGPRGSGVGRRGALLLLRPCGCPRHGCHRGHGGRDPDRQRLDTAGDLRGDVRGGNRDSRRRCGVGQRRGHRHRSRSRSRERAHPARRVRRQHRWVGRDRDDRRCHPCLDHRRRRPHHRADDR